VHPERAAALEGRVEPAVGPREAVEGAEVVITAVPIAERPSPPIASEWLSDRYLVLPLDFDASFQSEPIADSGLFVTDDVAQFDYHRGQGHFQGWPDPHGSVGDALGREVEAKRVACCNLGVGALDAAFARAVYDRALEAGAGTRLPR
jgi:ornithine cyclodeaminase/alanine dehydrogenase-like protein (mu-crystallin family)